MATLGLQGRSGERCPRPHTVLQNLPINPQVDLWNLVPASQRVVSSPRRPEPLSPQAFSLLSRVDPAELAVPNLLTRYQKQWLLATPHRYRKH